MARISTADPLDKFRWLVDIPGFQRVGFTSTQTPGITMNVNEYPEGGAHYHPRIIIDSVSYKKIALERGVTIDPSFSKWAAACIDLHNNNALAKNIKINDFPNLETAQSITTASIGFNPIPFENSTPFSYRKDIKIYHVGRDGQIAVIYTIYNAIPVEYTPASDFQASEEGVSIEKLVLAYEGFDVRYNPGVSLVKGAVNLFT